MKKKLLTLLIALIFTMTQISILSGVKAEAETSSFSADVVIQSTDKVLATGVSDKTNALEAVKDILSKNNINSEITEKWGAPYIQSIDNVESGKFGGYDGWLYAVVRDGSYVNIMSGISDFQLQTGDKLILYYGDLSTTVTANKIEYSTTSPNKNITIGLNNVYDDWQTGKPVVQQIKDINVKIDGKQYALSDNKINISSGLSVGKHTLEISDFKADGIPKVVGDKIDFYIKNPTASVRVEGLNGTIVEDSASGANTFEIAKAVLEKNKIPFTTAKASWGSIYIDSINGLKEKNFKGFDGWLFYVKKPSMVVAPDLGMDGYIPDEGDNIVIYYGDYTTPYVNNIEFTPSTGDVVKENLGFKMKFSYKSTYWYQDGSGNWLSSDSETLISKAIVNIDNQNYITDEKGEINISGLSKGTHIYKISGYNIDKLPTVIMDKGVFTIDNLHNPSVNYEDSKFDDIFDKDNSIIKKDIEKEISDSLNYIKNNSKDPWASISLNKFGIKSDQEYIKNSAAEIKKYGVSDYINTDLERLIISLTANGYSPYDFMGYNLVSELFNRNINDFLINDAMFGLIVYKYSNVTEEYKITKEKLVDYILSKAITYKSGENEIYGWALTGDKINPDITGGIINALSQYYNNRSDVKASVDKAVKSLSLLQTQSGYLADNFGMFSESLSFTILGLTSIGVNPEGIDFTKIKGDLVSGLLSFKGTDGQFKHALDGNNNYIATEQALRALIALNEFKKSGKYDFFMSNIISKNLPVYVIKEEITNSSKPETVQNSKPVSNPVQNALEQIISQVDEKEAVNNNKGDVVKAVNEALESSIIRVDASKNSLIDKEIFEALKGQDKTVIFEMDGIKWAFNGLDIDSNIKDINIALNKEAVYDNEIKTVSGEQAPFILSFKDNGNLPGKASVTLKLDEKWIKNKNTNNIYLYYYNPESKKAEMIEGPLKVNEKGEITIHLTHCSDYFLTDKKVEAAKTLQTAKKLNMGAVAIGSGMALAGLALIVYLLRSKKEAMK